MKIAILILLIVMSVVTLSALPGCFDLNASAFTASAATSEAEGVNGMP